MDITIKNANENNLKNISLTIPKNKLVVFSGISGSGKSTIVFDIIHSEAQRQYLESLSSFSRKGMQRFSKANFDSLEGISPTIVIDQKQLSSNPRSTVGTMTETYTYLRLLYSRFGTPSLSAGDFSFNTPSGACENCKGTGKEIKISLGRVIDFSKSLNEGAILHRTYKTGGRDWNIIAATGYFDMDKKLSQFTQEELDKLLYAKSEKCTNKAIGFVQNFSYEGIVSRIMKRANDSRGLEGVTYDSIFTEEAPCNCCHGSRVNERARNVLLNDRSIVDLTTMEIKDLSIYLKELKISELANDILDYLTRMLQTMVDLGLQYLTLSRSVATLSNGESQRLKLSRQLNSSLSDIIYILDEPTSGLHARDVGNIAQLLSNLVLKDNTVLVVEHDRHIMESAGYIVDIGPYAGKHGGEIVYSGNYKNILNGDSLTAKYLKNGIAKKSSYRIGSDFIEIFGNQNNLKNLQVKIPKNIFVCITGVSGSGKSSLIDEMIKQVKDCIVIDQSKIGTTTRSNAATYVKAFDEIRALFAAESGLSSSMFSFNSKGSCINCGGLGVEVINMHFLGDVRSKCEECNGSRYIPEVLVHKIRGKNINDVLEMTIEEALDFFKEESIKKKLDTLSEIGLGYLTLGQSFDTLSGGEAQRIKLAKGLSKKGSIYIIDEPSRGLHMYDVDKLLQLLDKLIEQGNSVIVVEHNLDIIKNADYIIDLGPEGGDRGGRIVASGTPIEVAKIEGSYTGQYLKEEVFLFE